MIFDMHLRQPTATADSCQLPTPVDSTPPPGTGRGYTAEMLRCRWQPIQGMLVSHLGRGDGINLMICLLHLAGPIESHSKTGNHVGLGLAVGHLLAICWSFSSSRNEREKFSLPTPIVLKLNLGLSRSIVWAGFKSSEDGSVCGGAPAWPFLVLFRMRE